MKRRSGREEGRCAAPRPRACRQILGDLRKKGGLFLVPSLPARPPQASPRDLRGALGSESRLASRAGGGPRRDGPGPPPLGPRCPRERPDRRPRARPPRAVRTRGLGLEAVRPRGPKGGREAGGRGVPRPRSGRGDPRQPRAPGASARRRGGAKGGVAPARGRSRGGFRTQIPRGVEALGNPVEFLLRAGPEAAVTPAQARLAAPEAAADRAEKASDRDAVVRKIPEPGAAAVIPPQKNRQEGRDSDTPLDQERQKVEGFSHRIQPFRRVATRDEKTARNFLGFVPGAAVRVRWRSPQSYTLPRYCLHALGKQGGTTADFGPKRRKCVSRI
jgi:transposase